MSLKETLPQGSKLRSWLDTSDSEHPKQQTQIFPPVIPPFMYTIMVSLIWECKNQQALIDKQNTIIAHFGVLFHREQLEKTKMAINNQLTIYNSQLRKMCERLIATKIQLIAAQTVIKKISIADHKDLLVKAAKYYCMMAKQFPINTWFKQIHTKITLEIKYVNHYEFHEMEQYKL